MNLAKLSDKVEWSSLSKSCLICAQEKPLNNFYSRGVNNNVITQPRPTAMNWLMNYLKMKVTALRGSLLLQKGRKELIRDINILDCLLEQTEPISEEDCVYRHPDDKYRDSLTFTLGLEQADQLSQILINEYKHMKSYDDDYVHNDMKIINYILWLIDKGASESREDVCSDCLKKYHPLVHSPKDCDVCCRQDWYNKKGICEVDGEQVKYLLTPEDFSGWTHFKFSYEIPRIRPARRGDKK